MEPQLQRNRSTADVRGSRLCMCTGSHSYAPQPISHPGSALAPRRRLGDARDGIGSGVAGRSDRSTGWPRDGNVQGVGVASGTVAGQARNIRSEGNCGSRGASVAVAATGLALLCCNEMFPTPLWTVRDRACGSEQAVDWEWECASLRQSNQCRAALSIHAYNVEFPTAVPASHASDACPRCHGGVAWDQMPAQSESRSASPTHPDAVGRQECRKRCSVPGSEKGADESEGDGRGGCLADLAAGWHNGMQGMGWECGVRLANRGVGITLALALALWLEHVLCAVAPAPSAVQSHQSLAPTDGPDSPAFWPR